MTVFIQAAGGVLLSLVLGLTLDKQGKDISILLTIAVCVMVMAGAISCLKPVMVFLQQLEDLGNLNGNLVGILFKVVGIGLLSEIVSLVTADAGRASLGKSLQILAGAVIMWISLPVFSLLLELIQGILGQL